MTFHVILNWLATTKSFQRWLRKKHMLTWVQSPPFLVCGFDVLLKSLYSWFAKFMWTINNVNTTVILPFVHGWNFKLCTAQKKNNLTPLIFSKQPTFLCFRQLGSNKHLHPQNKLLETNPTQLNAPKLSNLTETQVSPKLLGTKNAGTKPYKVLIRLFWGWGFPWAFPCICLTLHTAYIGLVGCQPPATTGPFMDDANPDLCQVTV